MTIPVLTKNSRSFIPGEKSYALQLWLKSTGFSFNPFLLLEASADSRLGSYLVGHEAFSFAWGNWHSFIFALAGGGKTALRVRVAQACWVGQEINRPFPIIYTPPFLKWGHVTPALVDHLSALVESCALSLLLTLAHCPHWFLRLGILDQQKISTVLNWCLPGLLDNYLQSCIEAASSDPLQEIFPAAFLPPVPPQASLLIDLCRTILDQKRSAKTSSNSEEQWDSLMDILLQIFQMPGVFILLDGIDSIRETASNPLAEITCISPLLGELSDWTNHHIYLKAFLPVELYETIQSWNSLPNHTRTIEVQWTPNLLAEVIRRRVYAASQGVYNSLSPLAAPDLRDIEILLAREVVPLPREMLVITQRVLTEQTRRQSESPRIEVEDVERAIEWYRQNRPDTF